jgi:2-dehydro-3-deoxygluconokinase
MRTQVVTFGEIMLRLSPPDHLRISQTHAFEAVFGGGESNVAVSLANFGIPVDFVTRLPENDLGEACQEELRKHGVGVEKILRGGDRLGIYFLEAGAVARPSKVTYDRAHSSFATIQPGMVDWDAVFSDAEWFHWTGITPAVSESAAAVCLEAVCAAKSHGLTVSCDLNYRSKLWKWGKDASEVMPELVSCCDIALGNEEDAAKIFGITAADTNVISGEVDAENYRDVCVKLHAQFPNLQRIAISLRGSISASHNTWAGILWHKGLLHTTPVYDLTHIVDRVGSGDAFMAGLIYGLLAYQDDNDKAIQFAVAASCLKHTIYGDFNLVTVDEVEQLMSGDASGRVSR